MSKDYLLPMLGTPKKDKKIYIYESGHLVPELISCENHFCGLINIWVLFNQNKKDFSGRKIWLEIPQR